jgi:hypothetical protein
MIKMTREIKKIDVEYLKDNIGTIDEAFEIIGTIMLDQYSKAEDIDKKRFIQKKLLDITVIRHMIDGYLEEDSSENEG